MAEHDTWFLAASDAKQTSRLNSNALFMKNAGKLFIDLFILQESQLLWLAFAF
jgi:hypothetical protein